MAPRVSVSQITTFRSSFAEDVRAYAAAGLDGIGVWELKLRRGRRRRGARSPGGERPRVARPRSRPCRRSCRCRCSAAPRTRPERVDAYCRSLERLAPFAPSGVVLPDRDGPGRDATTRARSVDGLRDDRRRGRAARPADRARAVPARRRRALVDRPLDPRGGRADPRRRRPARVGIQFDVWHLWNTPTLFDDIAREIDRFAGVHVCRLARADARLGRPRASRRRRRRRPRDPARARRRRLGRPVRHRDLLRRRHVRQRRTRTRSGRRRRRRRSRARRTRSSSAGLQVPLRRPGAGSGGVRDEETEFPCGARPASSSRRSLVALAATAVRTTHARPRRRS